MILKAPQPAPPVLGALPRMRPRLQAVNGAALFGADGPPVLPSIKPYMER